MRKGIDGLATKSKNRNIEISKYNLPDRQGSLFDDDPDFSEPEHTEEQSQQTISYTVVRKVTSKKGNDSLHDGIEVEAIHHYPENTICDCCQEQMIEIGSTIVREEATFIPAKMMKVQHVEHAYECVGCKVDSSQPAQIKRGKAPHQRFSVAWQVLAYLPNLSMINLYNTYLFDLSLKVFFSGLKRHHYPEKILWLKQLNYTLNRTNGLKAFLNNGRIEIDNNPSENAIRPNVIGRKNWLFSVSEVVQKRMPSV